MLLWVPAFFLILSRFILCCAFQNYDNHTSPGFILFVHSKINLMSHEILYTLLIQVGIQIQVLDRSLGLRSNSKGVSRHSLVPVDDHRVKNFSVVQMTTDLGTHLVLNCKS